jgi:hypothetical protein
MSYRLRFARPFKKKVFSEDKHQYAKWVVKDKLSFPLNSWGELLTKPIFPLEESIQPLTTAT